MVHLIAAAVEARRERERVRRMLVDEINQVLGMNDIADAEAIADRILRLPEIRTALGYYEETLDD